MPIVDGRLNIRQLDVEDLDALTSPVEIEGLHERSGLLRMRSRSSKDSRDSLVGLLVAQFEAVPEIYEFLADRGRPAWRYALYPGAESGQSNVSIVPVVAEGTLSGYLFFLRDSTSSRRSIVDYMERDYLEEAYLAVSATHLVGDISISGFHNNQVSYLWMLSYPYAVAEHVLFDREATGALVLDRAYEGLSEAGVLGVRGCSHGSTTTCRFVHVPQVFRVPSPQIDGIEAIESLTLRGGDGYWRSICSTTLSVSCGGGSGGGGGTGHGGFGTGTGTVGAGGTGAVGSGGIGTAPRAPIKIGNDGDAVSRAAAIAQALGLSPDEEECLRGNTVMAGIAANAMDKYGAARNCEGEDAQSKIKDALRDAIQSGCSSGTMGFAGVIGGMGEDNWINMDKSFLQTAKLNACSITYWVLIMKPTVLICRTFIVTGPLMRICISQIARQMRVTHGQNFTEGIRL